MTPDKFCGWLDRPADVAAFVARLPLPTFNVAAPALMGTEHRDVLFWEQGELALFNQLLPAHAQDIGDCVSHGFARGIQDAMYIDQAQSRDPENPKPPQGMLFDGQHWTYRGKPVGGDDKIIEIATEPIYALSRVEVGKGQIGSGDGSVGAWAAEAANEYGCLARGKYGNVDLARYDARIAKAWGMPRAGLPNDLEPEAKLHLCKYVTLIENGDQSRAALYNLYPIPVCSMQGFTMVRDSRGMCKPQGSWAHCFPAGTLVFGDKIREIQNVKVGDVVYDGNGNPTRVVATKSRVCNQPLVELKAAGRLPIRSTPDHQFLVIRSKSVDGVKMTPLAVSRAASGGSYRNVTKNRLRDAAQQMKPEWVRAEDLRPGDMLLTPTGVKKMAVPALPLGGNGSKPINQSAMSGRAFYWLCGLFVADGSIRVSGGKKVGICFTVSSQEVESRIASAASELGLSARRQAIKHTENAWRIYIDSTVLGAWFSENFYREKLKTLPGWAIGSMDVVEGIYDGDGCSVAGRKKINNTSRDVIESVYLTLVQHGFRPSQFLEGRSPGCYANAKQMYAVTWSDSMDVRGPSGVIGGYHATPIRKIDRIEGPTEVYDFMVESSEHSFIANGFVVHNCMLVRGIAMLKGGILVVIIQQSWGENPTGNDIITLEKDGRQVKLPQGCFAVDFEVFERKMISAKDSFALSGPLGFKARRPLAWNVFDQAL